MTAFLNPVFADMEMTLEDITTMARSIQRPAPQASAASLQALVAATEYRVQPPATASTPGLLDGVKRMVTGVSVSLLGGMTQVVSAVNTTMNPIANDAKPMISNLTPIVLEPQDEVLFDPSFFSDLVEEFHNRKELPAKAICEKEAVSITFLNEGDALIDHLNYMRDAIQSENRMKHTEDGDVTATVLRQGGYKDCARKVLARIGKQLTDKHGEEFDRQLVSNGFMVTMVPAEQEARLYLTLKQWVVISNLRVH